MTGKGHFGIDNQRDRKLHYVVDAFVVVRDDTFHVHLVHLAQPFAMRAHAVGRVEGKGVGGRFFVADAAFGAHQVFGITGGCCIGGIEVDRVVLAKYKVA